MCAITFYLKSGIIDERSPLSDFPVYVHFYEIEHHSTGVLRVFIPVLQDRWKWVERVDISPHNIYEKQILDQPYFYNWHS